MSFPTISPKKAGFNVVQTPRMSPQVRQLWEQLSGQIQPGVSGGVDFLNQLSSGDPSQFAAIEAPALRQFQGLQGNIASRFSGQGGLGARRSSGFQQTMTGEATDLAERLQAQRMGLQQGALEQLLGLYTQLMQNDPYQMSLVARQKKPSFWSQIMGGALPIAGTALGGIFGGPAGAMMGGQIGGAAGQGFMG